MRTKTVLLSALVGALGSVAAMAQTNVYSLNAVGYVNVTCIPGYSIISCPLIASPDNTLNTVMNNSNGSISGSIVYFYNPTNGGYNVDTAATPGSRGYSGSAEGWSGGGTLALTPGTACWFGNNSSPASNIVLQFVGTVPTALNYNMTNTLNAGFNLVSSILPAAGDLCSNIYPTTNASGIPFTNVLGGLTNFNIGDSVYYWYAPTNGYRIFQSGNSRGFPADPNSYSNLWASPLGDPTTINVGDGFWYDNIVGTTVQWVESYSVSQ